MFGTPLGGPLVRPLAHRRGGSDGVDGDDFVDAIGDVRDRLVGVHGLELALHVVPHFEISTVPLEWLCDEFRIRMEVCGCRDVGSQGGVITITGREEVLCFEEV